MDKPTWEDNDPRDYTGVIRSSGFGPRTAELFKSLTGRVIGQERAAKRLARSFSIHHAGLKDPLKPIIAAIFSGPTGTGKTMMAGELARKLIDDQLHPPMTAIDCQMYTGRHQLSRLIGSSPEFVGYDDMPLLSQMQIDSFDFWAKFRKMIQGMPESERPKAEDEDRFVAEMYLRLKPYISVVLFDEIEKAHSTIHNACLGIIDKGEMAMANPKKFGVTNFSNSVIIMTCNIGGSEAADMLSGRRKSLGFRSASSIDSTADAIDEAIYRKTLSMIRRFFPQEFVGRLRDQIVVFRSLPREKCAIVLENMLSKVQDRVNAGITVDSGSGIIQPAGNAPPPALLSYTPKFKEFLLDVGVSKEFGLRPLEQAVKKNVVLELANAIEAGEIQLGDMVMFDTRNGKVEIRRKPRTQALVVVQSGFDMEKAERPTDPILPPPDKSDDALVIRPVKPRVKPPVKPVKPQAKPPVRLPVRPPVKPPVKPTPPVKKSPKPKGDPPDKKS